MKKNYGAAVLGICFGLTALAAGSACAQEVTVAGSPVTLNVMATADEEDTASTSVTTDHFTLLAHAGMDRMLVVMDGEEGYVLEAELEQLFPQLSLDKFPVLEGTEAISPESDEELVKELQGMLNRAGALSGGVDGVFGSGTAEAVRKFQEAHGLEATGTADVETLLVLEAVNAGLEDAIEVSEESYASADEKFAQILDKTDADLEAFADPLWRFVYDPFEESGAIDPSIHLGFFAVDAPEVDRIAGDVDVKVMVVKDAESGRTQLIPALAVETEGAYRPYVQGAMISGEQTIHLEGGKSTGEIDGITLKESAYVPLTREAVALLQSGSAPAVRIVGKNVTYDVEPEAYDADKLVAFMETCAGLVEEAE